MQKNGGGSGFFGYIKRLLFGIIVGGITLAIIIFGFIDNHNNSTPQSNRVEHAVVNGAKNTYNQESGPLENYVKNRTNGDMESASPELHHIKQLSIKVVNHIKRTPVSHVSLDDSGNGIFVLNHKQYLFQLNDTAFAPKNSKFYQKNKDAIQSAVANEVKSGKFYVTRTGKNGINLYKGNTLVSNYFISRGMAYMPNLTIHNPVTLQMQAVEHHAKSSKSGFWRIPSVISGNQSSQTYDTPAESGQNIPGESTSNGSQKGGESMGQHVSSWMSKH